MIFSTVILPATRTETLFRAVKSVFDQTIPVKLLLVIDGKENEHKIKQLVSSFSDKIDFLTIPHNLGGKGYYGHRFYASIPHLVNTEYVLFLDQDCWFEENHVESLIDKIQKEKLSWAYSLRKLFRNGEFFCNDECESLGKWKPFTAYEFVDTNCYCIPTQNAIQCCHAFHGPWGQDRKFYLHIKQMFPHHESTGIYTLNYSLQPNERFPNPYEFFEVGNKVALERFPDVPWRAT